MIKIIKIKKDLCQFLKNFKRFFLSKFLTKRKKFKNKLLNNSGQGTTEYAILVGVLVVIAILAIMIFKPKLEELWNAIADGISGL